MEKDEDLKRTIQQSVDAILVASADPHDSSERRAVRTGTGISSILLAVLDLLPEDIKPLVEQALEAHILTFMRVPGIMPPQVWMAVYEKFMEQFH